MGKADLQQEINDLTDKLRKEKPTVYKHLTENPVTLPSDDDIDDVNLVNELRKYRDNLISLLNQTK